MVIPDNSSAEAVAAILASKIGEYSPFMGDFTITVAGDTVNLVAIDDAQLDITDVKFLPGTGTVGGEITRLSDTGTRIRYNEIRFTSELIEANLEGSGVMVGDKIFEFRTPATMDSALPGNIVVQIGATEADTAANFETALVANGFDTMVSSDYRSFKFLDKLDTQTTGGTGSFIFQIGANANDSITLSIGNMGASSLGLGGINIDSYENASNSLGILDTAIDFVSKQRANLGATQNRLEYTINNLSVSSENLISSESIIRDIDMAKGMMEFTKNNILSQVAQSMLAQANLQPQGILQLLS